MSIIDHRGRDNAGTKQRNCLRFIGCFVTIQAALIYLLTCRARYKTLLKDQSLLWQFRARCSENCKLFEDDEAGFFICFLSLGQAAQAVQDQSLDLIERLPGRLINSG